MSAFRLVFECETELHLVDSPLESVIVSFLVALSRDRVGADASYELLQFIRKSKFEWALNTGAYAEASDIMPGLCGPMNLVDLVLWPMLCCAHPSVSAVVKENAKSGYMFHEAVWTGTVEQSRDCVDLIHSRIVTRALAPSESLLIALIKSSVREGTSDESRRYFHIAIHHAVPRSMAFYESLVPACQVGTGIAWLVFEDFSTTLGVTRSQIDSTRVCWGLIVALARDCDVAKAAFAAQYCMAAIKDDWVSLVDTITDFDLGLLVSIFVRANERVQAIAAFNQGTLLSCG
jgi:hypothetical protein